MLTNDSVAIQAIRETTPTPGIHSNVGTEEAAQSAYHVRMWTKVQRNWPRFPTARIRGFPAGSQLSGSQFSPDSQAVWPAGGVTLPQQRK